MKYTENLKVEGLTAERAEKISEAFDVLHAAIAKLDTSSRMQFFSTSLETRLVEFAQVEGLMDITK